MAFRHYTKLKEIAEKYGCDSSGCNTNGALLDRIYESEVTPVDPSGTIDAKIDIQNITARFVRPVEGHSYLGLATIPVDTWLLELDNVIGYKSEEGAFHNPVSSSCSIGGIRSSIIFNDVENANSGNLILITADNVEGLPTGFTDEQVETIKSQLPVTLICSTSPSNRVVDKLTITEIVDG